MSKLSVHNFGQTTKFVPLMDMTIRCKNCGKLIATSCISYTCGCGKTLLVDDYRPDSENCHVVSRQLKEN